MVHVGDCDTETRVALIAEIGNNHEGSVGLAEEMIGQAHESGASAIKLQTLVPEMFVSVLDQARLAQISRFALSHADTERLILGSAAQGICVFSTPLDLSSLAAIAPHVTMVKVASGDITFVQLLEAIAATGLDTILSTGASTLAEVAYAVSTVEAIWQTKSLAPDLAILHCVSNYPAVTSSVSLRAMTTLASAFPKATIGFSDHTMGIETAVAAGAAGARIIEKHFTLDKEQSDFRDHALSATPAEFRELRDRLDFVEELLGSSVKIPHESEEQARILIRRSLVLARDVEAGQRLTPSDLLCMRPATGLPPAELRQVLGRELAIPKYAGQVLQASDLS